ncbi:MAG: GAF domain-containing protein [Oscillospiraceae bacterium]|nr:GAF domain-containing protein [Oscillospiraceae bacterium]
MKKRFNFKKNRTVIIIMSAMVTAFIILHLIIYNLTHYVLELHMMNTVQGVASASKHTIEFDIDRYLEFVAAVKADPERFSTAERLRNLLEEGDPLAEYYFEMNRHFGEIKEAGVLEYIYVVVFKDDGIMYVLDAEPIGSDYWSAPGDEDDWDVAMQQIAYGETVYSAGFLSESDWGDLIVAYAVVHDAYGNVVGMVGADISSEYFFGYLDTIQSALYAFYVLCLLVAWFIIMHFSKRAKEAQERLMLMLDTSPLCAQIWARDLSTIDCNEAAVRLYKFRDKAEYIERFLMECSAEIQPDGQRADVKAVALVNQAFEEGYCQFEWLHRIPDEDVLFPAEVTLVRAKYKDQDVVIGYTRDLREHEKMMKAIEYRDNLMRAVNQAAVLLLDYDADYFENALYRSMITIAEAVKVDCLYIWKNHEIGGMLHCSQLYEWSKQKTVNNEDKTLYSYYETFPSWEETLSGGYCINGPISGMSVELQALLTTEGIISILVVPIFIKDEFWGFVGFGDNKEERNFIEEEISILSSASLLIASSFIHNEMIHGIRETAEKLREQENLLQAVNQASAMLLTTKDGENMTDMISTCLELIGTSMSSDRLYIWQSLTEAEDGTLFHEVVHSWDSETAKEKVPVPIGMRTSFKLNGGLDWDDYFLHGDCINGSLSTFSEKEQTFISMFDLKAVAVIPMFLDEHLWGILCIGDCEVERIHTEEELAILRSVSLMLASAINRHTLVEKRTRELATQTATFTTLFDSIPDLLFTKDTESRFIVCNKALLEHFGKSMEELVGEYDGKALGFSAQIIGEHDEIDRQVINERRIITIEEHIPHTNGTNPFYETTKVPLIVGDDVIGILGIARDITERKEMERKLTDNYEYAGKLNDTLALITNSPAIASGKLKAAAELITQEGCNTLGVNYVGIWMLLENGNALESVSYYSRATGEHSVKPFYDLTLERRQKYKNLLHSERLITMTNIEDCKAIFGGFGIYESTGVNAALDAPIRIDGKLVGVVCVEQEKCEEYPGGREWLIEEQNFASSLADLMALAISGYERRKARDAAEIANRSKSAFIANISHEIRTPMNVIMGLTELMMDEEETTDSTKDYLEKIHASGSTLTSIINDILDISKMESGKFTLTPVNYQLASMLNDIATFNVIKIDEKPITFSLEIEEGLYSYLHGDDLRVRQILNNLLSNAFKYTKKGVVTLKVSCKRENEKDVKLIISVSDTGMGIRKEDAERLFKDYHQVDAQANRKIEGTGLGLSITKKLTELMGGDIELESVHGLGSVFRVEIRQGYVNDELVSTETINNLREFRYEEKKVTTVSTLVRPDLSYARVLIVDDFPTNLDVAKGMLGKYKMKVDCVMSGQDAIDAIKAAAPVYDAIFMDHMMPGMDGIETADHIRALGTDYAVNMPIIALTANAAVGNEEMFLAKGFRAFLSKPINVMKLDAVVRKWIMKDGKQPTAGSRQPPPSESAPQLSTDDIPGINMKLGLSLYEDDMEMFVEILTSYAENIPAEIEKLYNVSEENLRDYAINIHTIKGAFAGIGAKELSLRAKEMERMAKAGDLSGVQAVNDAFIKDSKTLLKHMNKWLANK